jgi:glutamine amidotransferase-like uncharacterized protein
MKALPALAGLFFLTASMANADARPLALVYVGRGAMWPSITGAKRVAELAGFEVQEVDGSLQDVSVFDRAQVWIQPGGSSLTARETLGERLMSVVREFVERGGGYVGFCAGGFLSTEKVGSTGVLGFGFVPGSTRYHIEKDADAFLTEKVWTPEGERWVFFAGGPQWVVSESELQAVHGRVIARASDGQVIALEADYGRGKVVVSGFHPEADVLWKTSSLIAAGRFDESEMSNPDFKVDNDGDDYDFAVNMIRVATLNWSH